MKGYRAFGLCKPCLQCFGGTQLTMQLPQARITLSIIKPILDHYAYIGVRSLWNCFQFNISKLGILHIPHPSSLPIKVTIVDSQRKIYFHTKPASHYVHPRQLWIYCYVWLLELPPIQHLQVL